MGSDKYKFQKLTPTDSADISVYEDAIDFVFQNSDIRNVAISGAYSAGKSSLIESYKVKHADRTFLHLSLAHFITSEEESNSKEKNGTDFTIKESVLEGKILNQLLHQIPADKIPLTNFRVKKGENKNGIWGTSVAIALYILGIIRIVWEDQICDFIGGLEDENWFNFLAPIANPTATVFAAWICIIGTVMLIYWVVDTFKNRNLLKRISLNGNEIEIFENQDESYFDKYLNEVLYLFENSGADVIVFEDMDRFNSSQIFERLHEINRLVNVNREKEDNQEFVPLRFFYLIRDDMFVSKDRTKFFDYIVPVVPVVDSSNSYDKFLELLGASGYLPHFDRSFLQSLALYVDDMRILKNICNEFTIYINRINTIELDWNRMLAIITYKNLFPRDFSELQIGQGFVFELFQYKADLVRCLLPALKEERERLKAKIDTSELEVLCSLEELDQIYKKKFQDIPKRYNHYMGNYEYNAENQERYDQCKSEYEARKQAVEDKETCHHEELKKRLREVDHEIATIQTLPLKMLINRDNVSSLFSVSHKDEIGQVNTFNEIKSNHYFALLKFLIRNGYIDETYSDYMTYFYEDSITAHDKTFLRRITDRRGAEYTYKLYDPEKVAECAVIRNVEFEQEEILNFDLLDYLLQHMDIPKFSTYINILIEQLKSSQRFDFLALFYALNRCHKQLVSRLNEQWDEFFQSVVQTNEFNSEQAKKYSLDTLYFSKDEIIRRVNGDGYLSRYISCTSNYLVIPSPDVEKIISGFKLIGVSIQELSDYNVDPRLFEEIYQENLYALNFSNISFLLQKKYGCRSEEFIKHKNFTVINSKEEPLLQYVMANLPLYMTVILENCNEDIRDDEAAAIKLLNLEGISSEHKTRYIAALGITIERLSSVQNKGLWELLIKQEKIEKNPINLLHFYLEFGLTDCLIQYANSLPQSCDFSSLTECSEDEKCAKLFVSVAKCESMDNNAYRMILTGLNYVFLDFEAKEIPDDKFQILIEEHILQMDIPTLQYVRNSYPHNVYSFIQNNFEDYVVLQSRDIVSNAEVIEILNWEIPEEKKFSLLALTDCSISIKGKHYSDAVAAYILEHNYNDDDLESLCADYATYGKETKNQIAERVARNITWVISYCEVIDCFLVMVLLDRADIAREHKIQLFTKVLPSMTVAMCRSSLCVLGLEDLNGVFSEHGGRKNYPITPETTEIFEAMKNRQWIFSYQPDSRNTEKYVVTKNPPRNRGKNRDD